MKNFAFLLLFALLSLSAMGQVYVQNTMYRYSPFIYNPGAAGMTQSDGQGLDLTFLGRLQWVGLDGAPRLSSISGHAPIEGIGGVGGYIIADQLGPLTTTGINVAYAFHFPEFGRGNRLSVGINGGFLQKSFNGNFVTPDGVVDPLLGSADYSASSFVPNLGAGIYFHGLNNRLTLGVSAQDLLEPSIEGLFVSDIGSESRVPRSFYFSAGYTIPVIQGTDGADVFSLTPMVFARTEGVFPPQMDFTLYGNIQPLVVGLSYRFFNDSFAAILGFDVNDRMFLGYSFDYTLSPLNASGDLSSHEIILSWTLPGGSGSPGSSENIRNKVGTGINP